MKYFLSLGSNLGDREKNIAQALLLLEKEGVKIRKTSSLYETQPVDFRFQPWFFNKVVEVEADFTPGALLILIKKIEKKMGRRRPNKKGPRLIDIDILLAGKTVIQTKSLQIPHARIEKRNFVLIPFREISPDTIHPLLNEKINDVWKKSKDHALVRLIKESVSHDQ